MRPSGLEPESSPWKGEILPLYYGRVSEPGARLIHVTFLLCCLVARNTATIGVLAQSEARVLSKDEVRGSKP